MIDCEKLKKKMLKMNEATAAAITTRNTNNRRSNISYKAVVRSGIIRTPIPGPKIAPSQPHNTNHSNKYAGAATNSTSLSSKPKLRGTLLSSKKTFSSTTTNSVSSSTSSEEIDLDTSIPFIHIDDSPVLQIGNSGTSGPVLDMSVPYIHIVNTPFQQHDKNLSALGAARLELFETFCLPTMVHQTIQPNASSEPQQYRFIWIIKVDPKLDPKLRNSMVKMLRPYPNFFLVGSNSNLKGAGLWRSGKAGNDVLYGNGTTATIDIINQPALIYTGEVSLLRLAHAYRNDKIVLDTRLDADDGLPLHYLENIQKSALKNLSSDSNFSYVKTMKKKWMFWCISHSFNWHSSISSSASESQIQEDGDPGRMSLEVRRNGYINCLTPGLTSGISVGVRGSELPSYPHHKLLVQLKAKQFKTQAKNACGRRPCLQVLDNVFAIRARTPTSAGMDNVLMTSKMLHKNNNSWQWQHIFENFAVRKERIARANSHLQANLVSIAKDNLKSQCSHGHSCKEDSKLLLSLIINNNGFKNGSTTDTNVPLDS